MYGPWVYNGGEKNQINQRDGITLINNHCIGKTRFMLKKKVKLDHCLTLYVNIISQ